MGPGWEAQYLAQNNAISANRVIEFNVKCSASFLQIGCLAMKLKEGGPFEADADLSGDIFGM